MNNEKYKSVIEDTCDLKLDYMEIKQLYKSPKANEELVIVKGLEGDEVKYFVVKISVEQYIKAN